MSSVLHRLANFRYGLERRTKRAPAAYMKKEDCLSMDADAMLWHTLLDDAIVNNTYLPYEAHHYLRKAYSCGAEKKNDDASTPYNILRYECHNSIVHIVFVNVPSERERDVFSSTAWLVSSFFSQDTKLNLKSKVEVKNITIYYAPAPGLGKKTLRNDSLALVAGNLNSGVTVSFPNNTRLVVVYRAEEAVKVLIHELIHAHGVDRSAAMDRATLAGEALSKIHGVVSSVPVRILETYTELLAAVLYTFLFLHPTPTDPNSKVYDEKLIKPALVKLFAFFQVQAEKLLCVRFIKSNSDDDKKQLHQDTHAWEYVVAKAAVVRGQSISKVLDMLDNHAKFEKAFRKGINSFMAEFQCGLNSLPLF